MIIFLIILFVVFLFIMGIYNNLVSLRERVKNAWAQIDTQLKRRFDLIPNLIETVKGYASHEQETLENIIKARNAYNDANGSVEGSAEAEGMLNNTLKNLFALAESYPELKANENFKSLQIELSGTEDKIAYARQFYNDTVQKYNQSLLIFPNNFIVSLFGKSKFEQVKFFEITDKQEKEPVKVQF